MKKKRLDKRGDSDIMLRFWLYIQGVDTLFYAF
jgi:hypothetical protein